VATPPAIGWHAPLRTERREVRILSGVPISATDTEGEPARVLAPPRKRTGATAWASSAPPSSTEATRMAVLRSRVLTGRATAPGVRLSPLPPRSRRAQSGPLSLGYR